MARIVVCVCIATVISLLGGCGAEVSRQTRTTPQPEPAAASVSAHELRSSGAKVREQHWLSCRAARRLCRLLTSVKETESADRVAYKRTICQLYYRFGCVSASSQQDESG